MTYKILNGDCIELMRGLPENSIDAIVTVPPYGIGFMGKAWDHADIVARAATTNGTKPRKDGLECRRNLLASEAGRYDLSPRGMRAFHEFSRAWGIEALRVLKPGGHLLSFASTRTYHRMVCGLEEAGLEVRDQIGWLFGSGFPKSRNGEWGGTALKPAWEPIVVARKPLCGTVEANWREHGTGGLNIDACRVSGCARPLVVADRENGLNGTYGDGLGGSSQIGVTSVGRWPANVVHDGSDEVLAAFPDAPGQCADASLNANDRKTQNVYGAMRCGRGDEPSADSDNGGAVGFKMRPGARRGDAGSAARFFYCAKSSRADRNAGLENPGPQLKTNCTLRQVETAELRGNIHPTVKPTALMRWLVRLVTPEGGTVLDPFLGSGSTGCAAVLEGFDFIGMEKDVKHGYVAIAAARIAHAVLEAEKEEASAVRQKDLFA